MLEQKLGLFIAAACALTGFGCSDPVPPPPEAGLKLSLGPPPPTAVKYCSTSAVTKTIGNPPPDAQSSGQTVIDGEAGASVNCTVKGGGPFVVSASVQAPGVSFSVTSASVPAGGTAKARVGITTVESGELVDTGCEITPIDVKAGAIWASFSCGELLYPPGTQCGGDGFFVFESCSEG